VVWPQKAMGKRGREGEGEGVQGGVGVCRDDLVGAMLAWVEGCGGDVGRGTVEVRGQPSSASRHKRSKGDSAPAAWVFAARPLAAGTRLARVPSECILTSAGCWASEHGLAVREAARGLGADAQAACTPEVLLWLELLAARVDKAHRVHAYSASLAWDEAHEPMLWPRELLEELDGTDVGAELRRAQEAVQRTHGSLVPALVRTGALPAGCCDTWVDLARARGMCTSRGFPGSLQPGLADGRAVVMLPLFDLLNHKYGHPIEWVAEEDGSVTFVARSAVEEGGEVWSNYGARPNEQLLFSYGFCMPDNPHDVVPVALRVGEEGETLTFYIRRREAGGIPLDLWKALSGAGDSEDDGEGGNALAIGAEEVDVLRSLLERKASRLRAKEGADREALSDEGLDPRLRSIAAYRQGQRDILREAIADVVAMMTEGDSLSGDSE